MLKTAIWYKKMFGHIGKKSTICKPLYLSGTKHIYMGNYVRIREGARIEAIETYGEQKFTPQIIIGDDTGFEQNLHMTCSGKIEIGEKCIFSGNVMITDSTHEYDKSEDSVLYQPLVSSNVKIGSGSFIGFGARIMPGVILGKHCVVGTNAVVLKGEYPDYSVLVGVPARIVKKYKVNAEKK